MVPTYNATQHAMPQTFYRRAHRVAPLVLLCLLAGGGCRGRQKAHVLSHEQPDMVGSHAAGAETFNPLIEQAAAKLLARHHHPVHPASHGAGHPPPLRICFVGVENRSAEEIGDFKNQIYQQVDSLLLQSPQYQPISGRFVNAALQETRLRPDQLFLPQNRRIFASVLEQQGQPFDFLLYATITSGTTRNNKDYQRDYVLTLEMVDIHTGDYDKESATLRKGYHQSWMGKVRNYGLGR